MFATTLPAYTLPVTLTLPVTVPPLFASNELLARMNAAFACMKAALAVLNAGCICGNTLLAASKDALA